MGGGGQVEESGDLEDLFLGAPEPERLVRPPAVYRREPSASSELAALERGDVPGTQSIWVKTYGCAHNTSDSEYMAGQLASYGYTLVSWRSPAYTACSFLAYSHHIVLFASAVFSVRERLSFLCEVNKIFATFFFFFFFLLL